MDELQLGGVRPPSLRSRFEGSERVGGWAECEFGAKTLESAMCSTSLMSDVARLEGVIRNRLSQVQGRT